MKKYAIIYICTGTYSILWKDFYESAEKYFLCDAEKEYYVFTDDPKIIEGKIERVHPYYRKRMGWPYDTLLRWDQICSIQDKLSTYDYIVFCNANMEFLDSVEAKCLENADFTLWSTSTEEELPDKMPLERRSESRAYVPYGGEIEKYVSGRFILGKADFFLEMSRILRDWTAQDLGNGVIPVWHDESMENAYFYHYSSYFRIRYVGSEFAAIEELLKEGEQTHAIFRNKDRYGGNVGMRYNMTLGKIDIFRRKVLGKLHR